MTMEYDAIIKEFGSPEAYEQAKLSIASAICRIGKVVRHSNIKAYTFFVGDDIPGVECYPCSVTVRPTRERP